ncbi:hypothetical protein SeLEV6574_g01065 [Synchytrium endobioticum]|uniref:Uncharacterized protein n=1 Tax=Synchytrium endobioticum TaxID=286115 RepID=A0A507DEM3_9FUNG|nr:hypothetical protein SeLEV6574_g01065 [Synchytrium endobioticum]
MTEHIISELAHGRRQARHRTEIQHEDTTTAGAIPLPEPSQDEVTKQPAVSELIPEAPGDDSDAPKGLAALVRQKSIRRLDGAVNSVHKIMAYEVPPLRARKSNALDENTESNSSRPKYNYEEQVDGFNQIWNDTWFGTPKNMTPAMHLWQGTFQFTTQVGARFLRMIAPVEMPQSWLNVTYTRENSTDLPWYESQNADAAETFLAFIAASIFRILVPV